MEADLLGRGLSFPVRMHPAGGWWTSSGAEKVRQSILLILATAPGERQMRPDFGCRVHDLLFEPNGPVLHGMVVAEVRAALIRWEPRIDVLDVVVDVPAETPDVLLIRVEYRLRANNSTHNLVYPFFLAEGDQRIGEDG